jgi:hypothetical protein
MSIDGKKFNATFLLLSVLVILSIAWYSSAQEQSTTQNNIFLDSDQDGLTDQEEKTYGTDPNKADTDGDGYSDGSEVKSGYDPLKAAPGDKLAPAIAETNSTSTQENDQENMTQVVAEKISALATDSSSGNSDVSLEEINNIVDEALNVSSTAPEIASFTKEDLKIKKQDFSGLSTDQIKKKKKDDFSTYITQVFYIISSNSPTPITSNEDFSSINSQLTQTITSAILSRDASSLEDLQKSGNNILEQMKEVEVPEDLIDTHLKALNFYTYSEKLVDYINPNPDDPVEDMANFSQLEGFISSLMTFNQEVQSKFSEYGLTYDETMKKQLKDLGIELDLESTSDTTDTTTDTTSASE